MSFVIDLQLKETQVNCTCKEEPEQTLDPKKLLGLLNAALDHPELYTTAMKAVKTALEEAL